MLSKHGILAVELFPAIQGFLAIRIHPIHRIPADIVVPVHLVGAADGDGMNVSA